MRRPAEQQDLGGADQQRGLGARRVARQPALEEAAHHMPQRAEATQHGCDDAAHQRAVAVSKVGEPDIRALAVELLVERPRPPQHAVENLGRDPARRKAGGVVRGCLRSWIHDSPIHGGDCLCSKFAPRPERNIAASTERDVGNVGKHGACEPTQVEASRRL